MSGHKVTKSTGSRGTVNDGAVHDCMDAGVRAKQEARAE